MLNRRSVAMNSTLANVLIPANTQMNAQFQNLHKKKTQKSSAVLNFYPCFIPQAQWLPLCCPCLSRCVCDMCMHWCVCWRRCCWGHCVQDVQPRSLSERPVDICLNYWSPKKGVKASNMVCHCHRESYQQQTNFHFADSEKWLYTSSIQQAPPWPWGEKEWKKRDWILIKWV